MPIYISLLRGINVSGQKKIPMKELQAMYKSLKFKNVKTYIQSGNVLFETSTISISTLQKKIEKKIKEVFTFDVVVLCYTIQEWKKIIKNNPFKSEDEGRIYVTFLSDIPTKKPMDEINKVKNELEEISIIERAVYFFCPTGYGKTKLSNNFFENKLKVAGTTRNWKTVNTLLSLAEEK